MSEADQLMYGVHAGLQKTSVAELQTLWTRTEELGLDYASIWDHFYSADLTGPECLEAVTTHTALALSTDRVRVGSLVYSVGFRSVAVLANAIANIDQMSDGRAELGLGTGWHQQEYAAFGLTYGSPRERLDQLEETATVMRLLLHQSDPVTFSGTYVQLLDAVVEPRPVQAHLPICIGGGGEKRTLRLVARLADVWNIPFVSPEEYGRKRQVLADWCDREDRDLSEIRCSVNVGLATSDENLTEQFGALAEYLKPGVLMGSDTEMAGQLQAYHEAGATQINLAIRAPFDVEIIDRFAAVVASLAP